MICIINEDSQQSVVYPSVGTNEQNRQAAVKYATELAKQFNPDYKGRITPIRRCKDVDLIVVSFRRELV